MKRRVALAWPALALLPAAGVRAATPPPEVAAELPQAQPLGSGRLRFLGLSVYDARLWSPKAPLGPADWAATPLALEIAYARKLVGRLIAERSLEEMRRQADIPAETAQRWLAAMTQLFPDVAEGDRLTGIFKPGEAVRFFLNGRFRGEVRDPEFSRLFFGIWLSDRTSEPSLRDALLGRRP